MTDTNLDRYCREAIERGATHAIQIDPGTVVTAPWVRLKCRFGCMFYGKGYCCPPDTPTAEETQAVIDCYSKCILLHIEAPKHPDRNKTIDNFVKTCVELELEAFRDGYHKAFVYLAGPCLDCKECGKQSGAPCNFPLKARPAMEACGIDVYQTVRNNDMPIQTLKEMTETQNKYCLLLVE